MTQKLVPASELVEDFSFYPRNQVDDTHVNDLVKAISSGSTLPPIIADKSSNRIVDGIHRRRAWMKFHGDDTGVPVEWQTYKNDAELFLDAVRRNAEHGRRLDRHDQTRIVLRLQELNITPQQIASVLHVPEQEVRTLAVRIVYDKDGASVPNKSGLAHMQGKTLNDEQLSALKSVRSAEVGRLCIELIKLLDNDLVDYTNPVIRQRLQQLAAVINVSVNRIEELHRNPVTV